MNKKSLASLSPVSRRRLLAALGVGPLAAGLGYDGILKALDLLFGSETALAAPVLPPVRYFIEVNLRDQWDFMHFAVPPGLATQEGLIRAQVGNEAERLLCGLYQDPKTLLAAPGNFFLSTDSVSIQPHVADMAMVETVQLCIGSIHGHEAANGMRSPGRTYQQGNGRNAMWLNDDATQQDAGGDEFLYSSSPTPAMIHLNMMRQLNPAARAVALKFLGRSDKKHTVYHYAGNLSENGFLRIQSKDQLVQSFAGRQLTDPLTKEELEQLGAMLKSLDSRYLQRLKYNEQASGNHGESQSSFLQRATRISAPLNLQLTPEEIAYWSSDVPPELSGAPRMHLWEQCAMASKLIGADAVSTVALEFSFDDIHGPRPKDAVTSQGKITALCLARLIADLKAKNLWNDTLIMINSTDGGRSPVVDSYGDSGKNTMILAGGRIKGGYYGDIRVSATEGNVHTYSYHIPDFKTGIVRPQGSTGNDGRIPDAVAYRTILEAMGASSFYKTLPDVGAGEFLEFMLKP